jgi:hypothetical protein
MNSVAALLAALDLPASARVDRRVPKTLLVENGAPTAADKRRINDGIEELVWLATLKPTTIGVPEYRDDVREYLEIAVLHLKLRAGAKSSRLVELVHHAIPYPVVLIADGADETLSLAHKRWSQGEKGKTVLDGGVLVVDCEAKADAATWDSFLKALALGRQPQATLYALYRGWIDTLVALQAAKRTGMFVLASSETRVGARRDAVAECDRLEAEIARLRATAVKEKQMSRRVELNLELKRVEAAQAAARANL